MFRKGFLGINLILMICAFLAGIVVGILIFSNGGFLGILTGLVVGDNYDEVTEEIEVPQINAENSEPNQTIILHDTNNTVANFN